MTKQFEKKLIKLKETWSRYQATKAKLNEAKMESGILYEMYTKHAEKVAHQMREKQINEITTDQGTFKIKRLINAKIIDRAEADQYDQRYSLGLFQKTISGPRVKSWVTQQIEKNLKVPDFVDVIEVWTIDINQD
jgi:hypothetical protein